VEDVRDDVSRLRQPEGFEGERRVGCRVLELADMHVPGQLQDFGQAFADLERSRPAITMCIGLEITEQARMLLHKI
jgi:hypothetical protein